MAIASHSIVLFGIIIVLSGILLYISILEPSKNTNCTSNSDQIISELEKKIKSLSSEIVEYEKISSTVKDLEKQLQVLRMGEKTVESNNIQVLNKKPEIVPIEPKPSTPTIPASNKPPRHIFIDVGANDGSSVNYFMKKEGVDMNVPWTQGGSKEGKLKGRGTEGSWDIYVIEANPYFTDKLLEQKQDYITNNKHVSSYTVLDAIAITTENGPVTFKLDAHNKGNGNFGSTLMTDSRSVLGPKSKNITVQGLDIVHFLRNVVKITEVSYSLL